jgi:hypothetical protein
MTGKQSTSHDSPEKASPARTLFALNEQQEERDVRDPLVRGTEGGQHQDDTQSTGTTTERGGSDVSTSVEEDVFTPIADFCARIFGSGYQREDKSNSNGGRGNDDDGREGGSENTTATTRPPYKTPVAAVAATRKRPRGSDTMEQQPRPRDRSPWHRGEVAVAADDHDGGEPASRHSSVAPTPAGGAFMSQDGVAGTMAMMMMLHTQAGGTNSNKETGPPESARGRPRGVGVMMTTTTTATTESDDRGTVDGGRGVVGYAGRGNKKNKHTLDNSREQVHGDTTCSQQSPIKGFEYPDAASVMLAEAGQKEDSQMSFQTKVHAAEALTGLLNGSL